ncbi:hypothetical protein J6590_010701 [Homalodisca vitripennis]|nr:hypothetical protein J6590_010701 [Homalodisca vitripennis]
MSKILKRRYTAASYHNKQALAYFAQPLNIGTCVTGCVSLAGIFSNTIIDASNTDQWLIAMSRMRLGLSERKLLLMSIFRPLVYNKRSNFCK